MQDMPSSAVTVSWAGDTVTITVSSGLGAAVASQVREEIAAVAGRGPQRLVLDLAGVGDRFDAESLALLVVARHLLPARCVLEVRSVSPPVLAILRLAGWGGPDSGTGDAESGPGQENT